MTAKPVRVAFLTNLVSPYRRPMFQALATTPGIELTVVVNASREFDRPDWAGTVCPGVEVIGTRGLAVRRRHVATEPVRIAHETTTYLPWSLGRDLRRLRPDVVISTELGPRTLLAAHHCRRVGIPLIVWSYRNRATASAKGRLRSWARKFLLRHTNLFVGMGTQAREVLRAIGIADENIVDAPNATDTETFDRRLEQARRDGEIDAIRTRFGGRRIAMVAGRLLPLKGIEAILEQWQALPSDLVDPWRLVFLGSGPLDRWITDQAIPSVEVVPAVRPEDVAPWFGAADLHVFGSIMDVWGLVVQEAMLASTPTLCSVHAGCADDLIDDGRDGLLFDPLDPASMSAALRDALTRPDLAALGAAARERGLLFTPDRLADGFRVAIERVCRAAEVAAPTFA